MHQFEITVDGTPEGDFASQELADAAATAARHKPENKDKKVIVRPKEHRDTHPANPAPAVTPSTAPKTFVKSPSAVVPSGGGLGSSRDGDHR